LQSILFTFHQRAKRGAIKLAEKLFFFAGACMYCDKIKEVFTAVLARVLFLFYHTFASAITQGVPKNDPNCLSELHQTSTKFDN